MVRTALASGACVVLLVSTPVDSEEFDPTRGRTHSGQWMRDERDATHLKYLMFSDPMYLKVSNGEDVMLRVTGVATRSTDTLALSVNDEVVDEAVATSYLGTATLEYSSGDGLDLKVRCVPKVTTDFTANHECNVYRNKTKLGMLWVNKRLYPE